MIYIGFIITIIIAIPIGAAILPVASSQFGKQRIGFWPSFALLSIVGLIIAALLTLGSTVRQVPAGHVGLLYTFGDITGQREAGFNLIWPWQGFKVASVQIQTLCFMDENESKKCPDGSRKMGGGLDSFSAETQNVFIDAIVNIKVDPENVQELYRDVGETYVDKLIPGRIAQVFKDETVNYSSVDIAPAREELRAAVEPELRRELNIFSIEVTALLIENIRFNPQFEAAIEQKQIASQEALAEEERIVAAENRAKQAVAIAKGEAEANSALAESLRVNGNFILQFRAIENLADNVKIILLPEDSGLIPILGESLLGGSEPPE